MRKHLSGKLQTILTGDFRLWWGAEVRFGSLSEVKAIRFAVRSPPTDICSALSLARFFGPLLGPLFAKSGR
jgi:hypothetical protein